jgi:hypothetical protein
MTDTLTIDDIELAGPPRRLRSNRRNGYERLSVRVTS